MISSPCFLRILFLPLCSRSVKPVDFIHLPDTSPCVLSDLLVPGREAGPEHRECSALLNFEKSLQLVLRATVVGVSLV